VAASAVLFDLDGVLIDSEPVWTIAESELAARLGGTWSTELKAAIVGTRLDVSVPTILRWYGRSPTEVAVAEASGCRSIPPYSVWSTGCALRMCRSDSSRRRCVCWWTRRWTG
jgi:hypothetical protein